MNIILASQSPRRKELMHLLGHPFRVMPSSAEENRIAGETPADHVTRLSESKALEVSGRVEKAIVIGSDTVVVLERAILEKPESPEHAVEMLLELQGKTHTVFSGYALVDSDTKKCYLAYDTTEVTMRPFTRGMAERYVATGEPLDKAGAYGIQGFGAVLIDSIQGCYFNVMGLPLPKLMAALNDFTDGAVGYFCNNH